MTTFNLSLNSYFLLQESFVQVVNPSKRQPLNSGPSWRPQLLRTKPLTTRKQWSLKHCQLRRNPSIMRPENSYTPKRMLLGSSTSKSGGLKKAFTSTILSRLKFGPAAGDHALPIISNKTTSTSFRAIGNILLLPPLSMEETWTRGFVESEPIQRSLNRCMQEAMVLAAKCH